MLHKCYCCSITSTSYSTFWIDNVTYPKLGLNLISTPQTCDRLPSNNSLNLHEHHLFDIHMYLVIYSWLLSNTKLWGHWKWNSKLLIKNHHLQIAHEIAVQQKLIRCCNRLGNVANQTYLRRCVIYFIRAWYLRYCDMSVTYASIWSAHVMSHYDGRYICPHMLICLL